MMVSTLSESFKKKFNIFCRYQKGIGNAFNVTLSSRITEGIKRGAFGYRNFYHFRARIYLQQGLIFQN